MSHDFDPQRPGGSFSLGWCNVSDCYAHADSPARMAAPCPLSMAAAYEIERTDAITARWRARQDAPATRDPSDYPAERAKLSAVRAALAAWDAGGIATAVECLAAVRTALDS